MLDAMRRSPAGQGREPPASHPAKRHDSMIQVAALRISNWPGSAVAQSPAVRRLAFCESLRRLFCQPLARCVTDPVFRGTSPRFTVERPLATVASETLAHLSPSPLHPSSQAECRGFDPHHPLHSRSGECAQHVPCAARSRRPRVSPRPRKNAGSASANAAGCRRFAAFFRRSAKQFSGASYRG